ncbi:MAG TPA: hypothetical protein DEQ38_11150 [Elusimicrobia bacterium]|nr:MAG: hypothetical protein A2089_04925 [Elusimicrobia bacterium GWD2_63_28]HCC48653.1 hypothetical protein [Elusimicrobiota bacterium]
MEHETTVSKKFGLWAGVILALGALAMPVLNPDLFWHLSAGKYIFNNLSLPSADFLSWTEAGAPWTDFEWLAQLIYYPVYALGGKTGFFLLKMALLGATLPVFYSILKLNGLGRGAYFALPLWGLALMANADLRPENFSVLFFALLLWRLEKTRIEGSGAPSLRALAGLALYFALWANLHAGFAYGLLLLAFYSAGGYADRKLWPAAARQPGLVQPSVLAAAAAGTLLNPWGIKIYSILFAHAAEAGALSRYLAEWAPPTLVNPWHWPFMAALLAGFGLLLLRFLREKTVPLAHLLVLGALAFEASRHTRHIVFFCMAAAVFSFDAAARLWEPERLLRRGRVLFGLALVYLALLVWPRYAAFKVNLGEEAAGAAAYLKANSAQLAGRKMYNPWTWGGYLGWALSPDYKVFTDGRYLFHKYLVPVSAAMADQETWEKYAVQNGFGLALFRRDRALLPQQLAGGAAVLRPAYLLFMPEEKWALVYWDAFSILFARRGAALPPEFRLLRAGDFESVKLGLCSGVITEKAVEAELALYYKAAAGARSTGEADAFRGWLGGFPAACRR